MSLNSLKVTLAYTLYTVPGKLAISTGCCGVFLNRISKASTSSVLLYYIPSLFGGSAAVALLWKIMSSDATAPT